MLKKFLAVFFITLIFTGNTYARFQTIDDASLVYDQYNVDIKVHKDGTYEQTIEMQITLLRENARSLATKFPISYNSDSTSVELIEAKTIYQGKEYPVDKKMIEDKSIGNDRPGFDDHKQMSISFPYSEVGSKIYVKYKERVKNPILDNQFFQNHYFGYGGYWKQSKITIDSEMDLRMQANDPFKKLSVSAEPAKENPDYFRKATITLTEPLYSDTINEVSGSSLDPDLNTYVSISSMDSWQNLGNELAVGFIEKQEQPLPELFAKIVKSASRKTNLVDQLNRITSELNEEVKYFGDWRTRGGKFIPQDLAAVASKKSGDCKDFATVTVKILKELGYKANVALVLRGEGIQQQENTLPSNIFNHAMVRLLDKDGNILWIDPTNMTSMADGVYPDIAGKTALVLDKEQSSYEQIPEVSEDHAALSIFETIAPSKVVTTQVEFRGEYAQQITAIELWLSAKRIEDFFFNNFAQNGVEDKNKIKSSIPKLSSRIVKPVKIDLQYNKPNIFFKNNLGYGYNLDPQISLFNLLIGADPSVDVNDLYIGHPMTLEKRVIMEKAKAENLENLNFEINTPFVSLYRKCVAVGENVEVTTKLVIHTQWIKNSELKSKEFQELQRIIKHEIVNSAIILN